MTLAPWRAVRGTPRANYALEYEVSYQFFVRGKATYLPRLKGLAVFASLCDRRMGQTLGSWVHVAVSPEMLLCRGILGSVGECISLH